jgi:alpha-glucoside transport system substrate-binding protein
MELRCRPTRREFLLAALVAVTASGCSGAAPPPDRAAAAAAPGAGLGGQVVEVAAVWADDEQRAFERVLDGFAQRTGARVEFTSAGDELPTVLQTRIAGGAPPDVAVLPMPGLVASLARAGSLQPLGPAVDAVLREQFAPVWRELGTVDGRLYGVVFKAAHKSLVWYDARALGPGFVPPADFDAFVDLLRRRADTGETPLAVGGADGWTLTDWFENVYLQTAGGEQYDRLAAHAIPWTHPTVRAALDRLAEVFRPEHLPGGPEAALQTEFTDSVVEVFGQQPSASIVFEGDFVAGVVRENTTAEVGEDARFFPFPQLERPAVVSAGDMVVALTDRPVTGALVEYLSTADAAAVWAAQGGFLSPNRLVPPAVYPDVATRSIASDLAGAETVRFDLSDLLPAALGGTEGDGLWRAMQEFLADPGNADEILADLEARAARVHGGR